MLLRDIKPYHNKNIFNQKGITLMETMFALAILVVGILAVLTMTTSSVVLSQASEQNIVAVNLAREGLELVRGIRDFSHYNMDQAALVLPDGVLDFFSVPEGCYVVGVAGEQFVLKEVVGGCDSIADCTDCRLFRDPETGVYTYEDINTTPTIFRRAVLLTPDGVNMRVLSKAFWSEHGRNHEYTLEDYLTEWQ
ncbi:MAG: prepilin-type N-terminal cleavage/methylation domain-containing protein [Patescibacteria group bacterium]|nr:prepilin-type N-terminal cleavage/methylation domain-containing protein [Patescibacteria group bacterium]